MSEAPVRKAPVTTDPASAPPHPQQRQDQVQDPRQEQRQEQRQDPRPDARQEQRQDQQAAQKSAQQPGQNPPQHLAQDSARESTRESARESARESGRESTPESSKDVSQRPVGRLEDEWQAVQYEFVDDPKSAVSKADDLVQRAIQELTSRHRTLSQQWQGEGKHETEDLRLALHRYRELFKSLVAVK